MQLSDRDWRVFVELREVARERFAEETLARVLKICLDEAMSSVQRQTSLQALMTERSREASALFDDFRRATASLRLHMMVQHELLSEAELEPFSLKVRRAIAFGR